MHPAEGSALSRMPRASNRMASCTCHHLSDWYEIQETSIRRDAQIMVQSGYHGGASEGAANASFFQTITPSAGRRNETTDASLCACDN
jgi:hypothetical protein